VSWRWRLRRCGVPALAVWVVAAGWVSIAVSPTAASAAVAIARPTIASGQEHTCALLPNGTVECWGYNGDGELGNGTTNDSATPVAVSGLTGAIAIATGWSQSCALLANRTVSWATARWPMRPRPSQ
jgi:alpha-tubulin suppressor-like RCC1 family protein